MPNLDIRFKAKAAGVPLWRIAKEMKISDMTLFRRLRKELSAQEKQKFLDVIMKIAAEQATQALNSEKGE